MKKAKLIILAGQSNAVGVGYTKYLYKCVDEKTEKVFRDGYENVLINYCSHGIKSNGFVKTRINCTESAKDTFGPELGIAKNLTERYPDETFYIVKCAYGGTSLWHDWRSPSGKGEYCTNATDTEVPDIVASINSPNHPRCGWEYNTLVELLKNSIALLEKDGYEPEIKAFFWMQGESDAGVDILLNNYVGLYDALLSDFRSTFGNYIAKDCVFVDAGISEIWDNYQKMNEQKREYAQKQGSVFMSTIDLGLTTKTEPEEEPDIYHYDAKSVLILGENFAKNLKL